MAILGHAHTNAHTHSPSPALAPTLPLTRSRTHTQATACSERRRQFLGQGHTPTQILNTPTLPLTRAYTHKPQPVVNANVNSEDRATPTQILQPGSTVATALSEGV